MMPISRHKLFEDLRKLCGTKVALYDMFDQCPKTKDGTIDLETLVLFIVDKKREIEDPHYLPAKQEVENYLKET